MNRFTLLFAATISALLLSQPSKADTVAFCAGHGSNFGVTLALNLSNGGTSTFKLAVVQNDQPASTTAGTAEVGGGDGMMEASLKDASGIDVGTLTWWVLPTITPRISLAGNPGPILLNCQNLWPQRQ